MQCSLPSSRFTALGNHVTTTKDVRLLVAYPINFITGIPLIPEEHGMLADITKVDRFTEENKQYRCIVLVHYCKKQSLHDEPQ